MKRILFSCSFVPPEWIEAHGFLPYRVWPGDHRAAQSGEGLCLYAAAYGDEVWQDAKAAAAVFTTVCDQMRRMSEWKPVDSCLKVFLLNVPSTWQRPAARKLYEEELTRLGVLLCRLGGQSPSPEALVRIMERRQGERETIRNARPGLSARQYAHAWMDHFQGRPVRLEKRGNAVSAPGRAVALLGGPFTRSALVLLDQVEHFGGRIVLDATDAGELSLPRRYQDPPLRVNPLAELADAYFGSIPHPSRRPNDGFYSRLQHECAVREVRGILFFRYPWCDLWHAELQRVRDETALPVLDLNLGDPAERKGQAAGRIQAFMEVLR
jgi:benzoyl-CoA reductase/2-hydroxyglutaryl-CoA dehydratase subunit BcrC/BadD/HgdB